MPTNTPPHWPARSPNATTPAPSPGAAEQGATYDLDHIDPYVPPDDGGPPGQTSTANTARLCRYHHRVKTHGHWRYQRTGPTAVTWTSPQGRTYTVDHTGTHTTD